MEMSSSKYYQIISNSILKELFTTTNWELSQECKIRTLMQHEKVNRYKYITLKNEGENSHDHLI